MLLLSSNPIAIERLGFAQDSNDKKLIEAKLERRFATSQYDVIVFVIWKLLSITKFDQSRGLLAVIL